MNFNYLYLNSILTLMNFKLALNVRIESVTIKDFNSESNDTQYATFVFFFC